MARASIFSAAVVLHRHLFSAFPPFTELSGQADSANGEFLPLLLLQAGHQTPGSLSEPFLVLSGEQGGGRSGGFDPGKENQNAGSQRRNS